MTNDSKWQPKLEYTRSTQASAASYKYLIEKSLLCHR